MKCKSGQHSKQTWNSKNFPIWHLTNTSFFALLLFSSSFLPTFVHFPFFYIYSRRTPPIPFFYSDWMRLFSPFVQPLFILEKSWSKLLSFLFCFRFVLFHFQSNKKVRKGCKYGWELIRFHSASLVCLVRFFSSVDEWCCCCCCFFRVRGVFKWMTLYQ